MFGVSKKLFVDSFVVLKLINISLLVKELVVFVELFVNYLKYIVWFGNEDIELLLVRWFEDEFVKLVLWIFFWRLFDEYWLFCERVL